MKKGKIITIVIILLFSSMILYSFQSGITGVTLKSSSPGCTCHSPTPSDDVTVTITGPDILTTNETAVYTVNITGGPLARGGTNIAASDGVLDIINGEGLRKQSNELTQIQPKAPVGGAVSFQFNYTAPANPGSATLFANGNSVNFNGNNSGDQWNFADNKIITVNNPTDVDDDQIVNSYKLEQNYPNPFNPSTTFEFRLANSGLVSLKVFDVLGHEVATLIEEVRPAGIYKIEFEADNYNLTSGVYFYQLKSGNFTSTKKFILLH
jgi:hypothetical protein